MALHCPARAFTTAKLLIRCRTPLTSLAHRSKVPVTGNPGCNTHTPPRQQHACRTACNTEGPPTSQCRSYSGLAAALSRQMRKRVAVASRSRALAAAAAAPSCATGMQRHQRRRRATAAAAAATAASALAAPGSTTVTAEELVAAHLAAIDSNRSKARFVRCLQSLQSQVLSPTY
jgi:hypothetical protein